MKKYTTLAVPVDLSDEYKRLFSDIPLSMFVRVSVRNMLNRCKKYDSNDVLQVFMYGDLPCGLNEKS